MAAVTNRLRHGSSLFQLDFCLRLAPDHREEVAIQRQRSWIPLCVGGRGKRGLEELLRLVPLTPAKRKLSLHLHDNWLETRITACLGLSHR